MFPEVEKKYTGIKRVKSKLPIPLTNFKQPKVCYWYGTRETQCAKAVHTPAGQGEDGSIILLGTRASN